MNKMVQKFQHYLQGLLLIYFIHSFIHSFFYEWMGFNYMAVIKIILITII